MAVVGFAATGAAPVHRPDRGGGALAAAGGGGGGRPGSGPPGREPKISAFLDLFDRAEQEELTYRTLTGGSVDGLRQAFRHRLSAAVAGDAGSRTRSIPRPRWRPSCRWISVMGRTRLSRSASPGGGSLRACGARSTTEATCGRGSPPRRSRSARRRRSPYTLG